MESAEGPITIKEQRHDQLASELRGIPSGFDERRHAELERELDRLSPLNEQATRLGARVDREPALRSEHEALSLQLAEARERVASLTARYEETRLSEDEIQRQRQEYEVAVAASRRAELELQAATLDEARAAEAVASAERARQELERTRELQAKLEGERRVHDELDRAYSIRPTTICMPPTRTPCRRAPSPRSAAKAGSNSWRMSA